MRRVERGLKEGDVEVPFGMGSEPWFCGFDGGCIRVVSGKERVQSTTISPNNKKQTVSLTKKEPSCALDDPGFKHTFLLIPLPPRKQ